MTGSIDTLSAAKALRSAGFDEAGAEAIVAVVRQASEIPGIDHLATKVDLDSAALAMKRDLETAVAGVRHDLETAVAGVRHDLETAVAGVRYDLETAAAGVRHDLEKAVVSLKLFVASTVLGGAAMIVLAQIITKAIGLAA